MTSRDFVYWLQGMFELAKPRELSPEQTELIKRHLALVFIHDIDPSAPPGKQEALNQVHEEGTPMPPTPATPATPAPAYPGRPPVYRC